MRPTNEWEVDISSIDRVLIKRTADDRPVCEMFYDYIPVAGDFITREQAIDTAQQIVDDWNFSCDELGT